MAYQTGSSAGGRDLLDKIRLFAIAQGWSVLRWEEYIPVRDNPEPTLNEYFVESGWTLTLSNSAGTVAHFHWETANALVRGMLSTGFDGSKNYFRQADASARNATDLTLGGFPTYWLFGDATQIACVVEITTGQFRHLGTGILDKDGAYVGGHWLMSTRWNLGFSESYQCAPFDAESFNYGGPGTVVRCDVEGMRWFNTQPYNTSAQANPGGANPDNDYKNSFAAIASNRDGFDANTQLRSPNTSNALTILSPIRMAVHRGDGLYSPIGQVRNIRAVNMELLAPKEEITFGTDVWKVFPISVKAEWRDTPQNYGSGTHGMAYKIVA